MDHRQKQFTFFDTDGKEIILTSRRFSHNVEQLLEKRFGRDVLTQFAKTHSLDFDVTFDQAKEDLPKLLQGEGIEKVDWGYDVDPIMEVYLFFIQYKSNAQLRLLESERNSLVSNLEILKKITSSIPEDILKALTSGTIPNP